MIALQHRHTFALPTFAAQLFSLQQREQLPELHALYLAHHPQPIWLLGEGSNTVFTSNYGGLVVANQLRGVAIHEQESQWQVQVASGENWHELVTSLVHQGIGGLENLALIPGSVGAAPVQNIGAYGVEINEFISRVEVFDLQQGKVFWLSAAACEFAYRNSIFKKPEHAHWLIVSVELLLPKAWRVRLSYSDLQHLPSQASPQQVYETVIQVRNQKLPNPQVLANAGSFFKNPEVSAAKYAQLQAKFPAIRAYQLNANQFKLAAGWLIDYAGLKQLRVGDIGVHQQQALVLVNYGNGTGEQLIALAKTIMAKVKALYDVELEPEVRVLNSTGLVTW